MKKRFPYTLLQSIILFFLGCILGIPVLFISDFFQMTSAVNEVFMFGFSMAICTSIVLIALIINKRNGLPVAFKVRLNMNQGLILLWGTILSFQLINAPFINLITNLFSSTNSNDIHYGLVYFIGAILLGPILEELVFRGTILNGMLENYSPRKAILLSAIIFGLVHGKPIQMVSAFLWGLLFGYTFYKTKSIVLVILLHITVNFAGLLNAWLRPAHQSFSFLSAYGQYSWMVYGIATIGLIIGSFLLFRKQLFSKYLTGYQKLL